MTGFGRGEAPLGPAVVGAEVRSVNGRHLELRARGVREIVGTDGWVRDVAGRHFRRGQVDVVLRLAGSRRESQVEIDFAAARSYLDAARELRDSAKAEGVLEVAALLALPGVARLRELDHDGDETERAARAAIEAACAAAAQMREREGASLRRHLLERLGVLEQVLVGIEARAEEVKKSCLARLRQRIAELVPDAPLSPGRLEQEVALYVDRMDVGEETVRLRSHLDQFRETLDDDPPVGRKLEFLLQEMGREVNTIGSKAADAPIGHAVVELKTELEKLREQVLNVE
jgi:uncharacterized protein (TIGR00255 family)